MLPLIYMTLMRAYGRQWSNHRRIALPTFWIWIYVSVTGVVVYFMLYHTRLVS
jgi:protein SCO1/2/putative membrane protein